MRAQLISSFVRWNVLIQSMTVPSPDITLIFWLVWSLCPYKMPTRAAQSHTLQPEVLRELLISLAIQMITTKVTLSDFSFGLDTYHVQYRAVHQNFTGKQLTAQLLGAVTSAPSAWGSRNRFAWHLTAPSPVQRNCKCNCVTYTRKGFILNV